ncbi:MAG TPA: hypothetical protein VKV95_21925 [Terriglobia bacterium]|nr:hypothetical protein [Terriglobia bacterium]
MFRIGDYDARTTGQILTLIFLVVGGTISAWIAASRMRKRIKKAIGKDASELELTSINTWMEVEEKEEQEKNGGERHG